MNDGAWAHAGLVMQREALLAAETARADNAEAAYNRSQMWAAEERERADSAAAELRESLALLRLAEERASAAEHAYSERVRQLWAVEERATVGGCLNLPPPQPPATVQQPQAEQPSLEPRSFERHARSAPPPCDATYASARSVSGSAAFSRSSARGQLQPRCRPAGYISPAARRPDEEEARVQRVRHRQQLQQRLRLHTLQPHSCSSGPSRKTSGSGGGAAADRCSSSCAPTEQARALPAAASATVVAGRTSSLPPLSLPVGSATSRLTDLVPRADDPAATSRDAVMALAERLLGWMQPLCPATSRWLHDAIEWLLRTMDESEIFAYEDEGRPKRTVRASSVGQLAPTGAAGSAWGGGGDDDPEPAVTMRTLYSPRSFEAVARRLDKPGSQLEKLVRVHQRCGVELSHKYQEPLVNAAMRTCALQSARVHGSTSPSSARREAAAAAEQKPRSARF